MKGIFGIVFLAKFVSYFINKIKFGLNFKKEDGGLDLSLYLIFIFLFIYIVGSYVAYFCLEKYFKLFKILFSKLFKLSVTTYSRHPVQNSDYEVFYFENELN